MFDIDGVLADVRHRLTFLERRPKDWDGFFDAAPQDGPLQQGVALAQQSAQDCEVLYLTGRPERCREDTLAWFAQHGLPPGRLAMRGGRDRRPPRVTKPETLARLARGRVVAVVVDDDEQVCAAYAKAGWTVLRADWMADSAVLAEAQEAQGRT